MFFLALTQLHEPKTEKKQAVADDDLLRWLTLWQQGDRQAGQQLFERTYPFVVSITGRHLGSSPDMEDVVQLAMMEFHRSLSIFRGDCAVKTWVYRICLNVIHQHLRSRMRKPHESAIDPEWKDHRQSTIERMEQKELLSVVYPIIHGLPRKLREVFTLTQVEGFSSTEAAEILDISPAAVWTRLHRAKKSFFSRIENHPYFKLDEGKDRS